MDIPPTHDEAPEKRDIFGMHIGDLGVVLIAFLCSVTLLLILFQESPFQKLEIAQVRQAKEARQAEIDKAIADRKAAAKARQDAIDKAVASGEVSIAIAPVKH